MNIGLIGCGRWGRFILRDLVALGCDVTVVARSAESRRRAAEGGARAVVGAVGELEGAKGVVVATPTSTHASVLWQALDLGTPIFVEKPLTDDPSEAAALLARAGDRVFVMDKWRYHAGIESMAAMVRSREFGSVRAITTRRLSWGQAHDDVDGVWIMLPHDLAIVREIAGFVPAAIAAVGSRGTGKDAMLTGFLGPDPVCVVEVSTLSPIRERRVLVEFDEAVVLLEDAYSAALRVRRPGSSDEELRDLADEMPLLKELAVFIAYLEGGPAPRSSAAEGELAVRRIAELRSMAGI